MLTFQHWGGGGTFFQKYFQMSITKFLSITTHIGILYHSVGILRIFREFITVVSLGIVGTLIIVTTMIQYSSLFELFKNIFEGEFFWILQTNAKLPSAHYKKINLLKNKMLKEITP